MMKIEIILLALCIVPLGWLLYDIRSFRKQIQAWINEDKNK